MTAPPRWTVEVWDGPAGELHARSAAEATAPGRRLRVLRASRAAVVLGSAQRADHIDAGRTARLGVDVVRRRSGGSAVLVGPGESLWVDLVIHRDDPLWHDDVGRAAHWVGAAWAAALRRAGRDGAVAWTGPMMRTPWSDRVCFAGVGPGEVVDERRGALTKLVGLSQRRSRDAALFQTAVPMRWRPADLVALLDLPAEERRAAVAAIEPLVEPFGGDPAVLLAALQEVLAEVPAASPN